MCITNSIIWLIVCAALLLDIPLVNAVNCGEVNLARPLIIAGSDSVRGEWPFAAALYRVDDGAYFCGGTVISHKHILTAAHCVQTKHSMNVRLPENVIVRLGAHNLSSSNEEGAVSKNVGQIDVHDDWNVYSERFDADIAILTLTDNITFSNYIQPVCIPAPDETVGPILNFKGYIIGWAPSNRSRVETLKHAKATVLNATYCYDRDPYLSHYSSQRTFCGWDEDGSPDVGDSGGGLLVLSGSAWVQVAIISATRTNRMGQVSAEAPAIYTNIREFRSWIVEKTYGAVGVANGMKLILNCTYTEIDRWNDIFYTCILHDLDIKNKNHEVFLFVGEHMPLKSDRDVEAIAFNNGTLLYLPDEFGALFPNLKFLVVTDEAALKSISRSNLRSMENLFQLVCESAKLEVLDEDALFDLLNLEVIRIEDTLLEVLHEQTFERNAKLRIVSFHVNCIRYLAKDLFKNNLLLEEVDFDFNFLMRIETQFHDMPNIKTISFNENICISSIHTDDMELTQFDNLIIRNCTSIPASSLFRPETSED